VHNNAVALKDFVESRMRNEKRQSVRRQRKINPAIDE